MTTTGIVRKIDELGRIVLPKELRKSLNINSGDDFQITVNDKTIDFTNNDNGLVAHELSKEYNIMTRSGMHCAPSAHKTLGTFPQGTVRFSLSHFTTLEEIRFTLKCIDTIARN